MATYMNSGGGRFAYPSLFGALKKFFSSTTIPANTYNYAKILAQPNLNLSPKDFELRISQYGTGIGSADQAERSYIFGSTKFTLNTSTIMFHVSNNGVKSITGLEVRASKDNFDFNAGSQLSQLVNSLILVPTFDPYGLSRGEVTINYTGSGKTYATYTEANFNAHQALEDDVSVIGSPSKNTKDAVGIASLPANGGIQYFQNLASDPFLSYERNNKRVIYGTPEDDLLGLNDGTISPNILLAVFIVGGAGDDTLLGDLFADELLGGEGNDSLNGGFGNDSLNGGEGNDSLNGGLGDDTFRGGAGEDTIDGGSFLFGLFEGNDRAVYRGPSSDYDFTIENDDSIRIHDNTAGRDGTDILKGVEKGVFSDKTIDLRPGQDIAFVIDTTGSMDDDIAAVKARGGNIINSIFDRFPNSRIAVVGYNDPGTNTFLSFTNQPSIEDRKTAAINAINSISVGGGGDFPEAVNAGLLRALSGGAGEWRSEAAARRIILFGDAPPKDTHLRSQVLALASNLGTSMQASAITTSSVASGLSLTSFTVTATEAGGATRTVPVEIFTVQIGNDPTTAQDFASLATKTGGETFNAANASEVVDRLIEAIETPVNNPPTVATPIPDQTTDENAPFTFPVPPTTFSDADVGDTLTLSAEDLPSWLSFDSTTNTFSGTPSDRDIGLINITVTATDSGGFTVSDTFSLNVINLVIGNAFNNNLYGTTVSDKIEGLGGKDRLFGGSGDDTLNGGSGHDELFGSVGNDSLLGGDGRDYLYGSSGNDILDGGEGRDGLIGGSGKDQFVLRSGSSFDNILDYQDGIDSFVLTDGLRFEDLTLSSYGFRSTLISTEGDSLAVVAGTNVSLIDASDFTVISCKANYCMVAIAHQELT